jgi:hypothetical protein
VELVTNRIMYGAAPLMHGKRFKKKKMLWEMFLNSTVKHYSLAHILGSFIFDSKLLKLNM